MLLVGGVDDVPWAVVGDWLPVCVSFSGPVNRSISFVVLGLRGWRVRFPAAVSPDVRRSPLLCQ